MGSNFCRPISALSPALLQSQNLEQLDQSLQNNAPVTTAEQALETLRRRLQNSTRGEEYVFDLRLFQSEEWHCLEALLPRLPPTLQEEIRRVRVDLLRADQASNSPDGFVNNAEIIHFIHAEHRRGQTLWSNPSQFRRAAQIITQNLPAILSRVGLAQETPQAVASRVWRFLHSYAAEWKERLENHPRVLNNNGINLNNWLEIVNVYGIHLEDFVELSQSPPALIRHLQHDLENPNEPPQLSSQEAAALHWIAQIPHVNGEFQMTHSPTAPLTVMEFERLLEQTNRALAADTPFYGMRLVSESQGTWQTFTQQRAAQCNPTNTTSNIFSACLNYVVGHEAEVAEYLPAISLSAHLAFSTSPSQHIAVRQFMEGGGRLEDFTHEPRELLQEFTTPVNLFLMALFSPLTQRFLFNQFLRRQCGGNEGNRIEAWRAFERMQRTAPTPAMQALQNSTLGLFVASIVGNFLDKTFDYFDIDTYNLFGNPPNQVLTGVLLTQFANGILNNSMRHFFRIYPQAFCRQTPPVEVSAPEPESTPVVERSPAPAERQVSEYRGPTMVDVAWEGSKNFVRENGLKVLGGAAIIVGGALILDDITGGGVLDDGIAAVLIRVGTRWLGRSAATGAVLQTVRAR